MENLLYQMIRQASREKDIDIERIIAALEDAITTAVRKFYKTKDTIRAAFNKESGELRVFSPKIVVEDEDALADPSMEITLEEALVHDKNAQVGEEVEIPLSIEGLGRIAAQSAKQVLYQKLRDAERENVYNDFVDKIGEVVNGTVKRFERGDIVIDLGKTEAVLPRHEQSHAERYNQGERIRAVIIDVHKNPKGPQVVLSRANPQLLIKLFEMEVPEIYDGTVVIKGAVREAGERAKIAVYSREKDVDPVGACVGMKGSRVQSIIRELRGEKIDIIQYSDDIVLFAQHALSPAKITRVAVSSDGDYSKLDVIVDDEQLSLAIGKKGQNVRLAGELIGSKIEIKSEQAVKGEVADALSKMLQQAMRKRRDLEVLRALEGVGEKTLGKLEESGYESIGALLKAGAEKLAEIPGLGPKSAVKIIEAAEARQAEIEADRAARAAEEEARLAEEETVRVAEAARLAEEETARVAEAARMAEEEAARAGEEAAASDWPRVPQTAAAEGESGEAGDPVAVSDKTEAGE